MNDESRTEKVHKALILSAKIIKRDTGIELTPSEFWRLRIHYLDIRREKFGEFSHIQGYEYETRARFLSDLFGIDHLDCTKRKLCGTEEFKQSCKNHVSQWRDERDYL